MKKITLLSLAAAAVLFTACGEDAKKAAAEATAKTTEAVKDTAAGAADVAEAAKAKTAEVAAAAKEEAEKVATAAAEKAAEVKAATEQKAADAAQALKDKAAATTEAVKEKAAGAVEATKETATETVAAAVTPENAAGKAAYAKCAGCHGADGKTKALGKSAIVAGQSAADLATALTEYKTGTRNLSGMGMLMKGQVASMSDDDIKAVSEYMSAM